MADAILAARSCLAGVGVTVPERRVWVNGEEEVYMLRGEVTPKR
jgi:hypothetical protein